MRITVYAVAYAFSGYEWAFYEQHHICYLNFFSCKQKEVYGK